MKKIIIAGAVALTAISSLASCKNDSTSASNGENTVSSAVADSVAIYYGRAFGANIYGYLENQAARSGKEIDKSELIKGIQYVVGANSDEDFLTGMKIGMDIRNFIDESGRNGMELSANVIMDNFRRVVNADSLNQEQAQTDYAEFSTLMNRVREEQVARQEQERIKKAEEADKAGTAFIENAKKADPSIKTTESGLSYKIENPGDAATKIGPETTAKVKYTGKLIDGTVFDSGEAEFSPNRVVPGFGEGMQLLGKGGKATLYIPGKLGYGQAGAGDKIGPNATLVFDIEIVDVPESAK